MELIHQDRTVLIPELQGYWYHPMCNQPQVEIVPANNLKKIYLHLICYLPTQKNVIFHYKSGNVIV